MLGTDIGIDLGTASILVYIKGKGVVLKEPSVVAFDRDTNKIKAIGEEARLMIGRTPGNIVAVRPLRQGVISDYSVTEKMLRHFIQKALGKRTFKKPRISVCVPSGVTEVEKKAVEDATLQAQFSMASGYNPSRLSTFNIPAYEEFLEGYSIVAVTANVAKTMSNDFFTSPAFSNSSTCRDQMEDALWYVIQGQKNGSKALADALKACGGK